MALAGYLTTVKASGTSTAMADEAMTNTAGFAYQLNDLTKRVWDRSIVPTFEDLGESPQAIAASDIVSIDYLFGIVTFLTAKTEPVVLKTGNFMPMTDVAGAHSYNLGQAGDVLDDTEFGLANNNGSRQRILGIRDVSLSVSRWDDVVGQKFFDALNNRTPLLMEVRPGGTGDVARGWYVPESEDHSGDVSSLEAADLSFQLDGNIQSSFNWGTP